MLGIAAISLQTFSHEKFLPSVQRCAELITPKTRAIVLVSPNNPVSAFTTLSHSIGIIAMIDGCYLSTILNSVIRRAC